MTSGTSPRLLDSRDARDVALVAELHQELLSGSPVAALGKVFMRRFYYRRLVQDGLIGCHLATDGDETAGFLAWTAEPELGGAIIRRYPLAFPLAIARALLTSVTRFRVLLRLARFSRLRDAETADAAALAVPSPPHGRTGELLSLGVREAYRTREYLRRTKRRHSFELLHAAIEAMHARGVDRFVGYVEHDNTPMLLLYQGLGCSLIRLPGARTVRAEGDVAVVLQALSAGSDAG